MPVQFDRLTVGVWYELHRDQPFILILIARRIINVPVKKRWNGNVHTKDLIFAFCKFVHFPFN